MRHEHIVEDEFAGVGAAHAELVELAGARESLEGLFYDESCDALGGLFGLGFGVNYDVICIGALSR